MQRFGEKTFWNEAVRVYLFTIKRCRPFLSTDEFLVLMFIFERTYGYKKPAEYISIKHFTDGVFTAGGECVTSPVGINKRNILRAIKQLVDKQLVEVEVGRGRASSKFGLMPPERINMDIIKAVIKDQQMHEVERGNIVLSTISESNYTTPMGAAMH